MTASHTTSILMRHQHAFLKLLSFRVLMVLAYQMMAVTVGWHIYEITHDPLALGLIGLAEVLSYFACALFAGHAVDRYSLRRFFAIFAAIALCINALMLAAIAMNLLGAGAATSRWIYGTIMLTGVARAFIAPTYSALFSLILPREEYARAAAVGSSFFQVGLIVGPAIGGLLVGFASKAFAYSMAAGLCVIAAFVMGSIKIKEPQAPLESTPLFTSIAEGLRFVFGNQIVLAALSLDMFAVLFGGAVAMLPAFIHDIYRCGPEALGVLRAAPAIGAIITGIWLARNPINLRAGFWLLVSVAGFGISIIGFGLSAYIGLAFVMLVLSGIFDGVSVVMRTTILQLATPDAMRGRVSAINGIFIGSSNELGAFESGLAARLLGLVPSVLFGGMMALGIVAVTAKVAPKLTKLELQQLH